MPIFKVETAEIKDDPRIPLTKKQKYLLMKNWKGIDREVSEAGVEMFMVMFSVHPEYYKMFSFKNIATSSDEKKRMDDCLRSHGEKVMKYISRIILSIGDGDQFFDLIDQNGRSHAHKNFTPSYFWAMEEPFLHSVKLILGERYTDNMSSIYKTVIAIILAGMEKGCENELKEMQLT